MKIYYSKKTKQYYIITDELMLKILDQIKEDTRITKVTTVTQVAAEVMPDKQKRQLVYTRLKKLHNMGLIEIVPRINIKYIIPKFKEIRLFEYTTILSIPMLTAIYTTVLYIYFHINPIYRPMLLVLVILVTLYMIIFFKERSVLRKIINL